MRVVKTNERRQHIRIEPVKEAPIRVDINGENFIDVISAKDISIGGIGIQVNHGFKGCLLNKSVSFIVELPYGNKRVFVKVDGKIKHASGDHFGICFHNISDLGKRHIQNYIASRIRGVSLVDWVWYKMGLIH